MGGEGSYELRIVCSTLFYICLRFSLMNTEFCEYCSLKKTPPVNKKVHHCYGLSCHFEKQAVIINTKLNQSYNKWELVLKMNYLHRIMSVKKNCINISLYIRHDKIFYDSEDLIERLFLPRSLDDMMSVEKISKKFPAGIMILCYSI